MIKRHSVFLFFLMAGLCLAAQDKATPPAAQLSGLISLDVGEKNLLESPYVSDVPGVSSGLTGASVALKFSDGASYSYLDLSQRLDEILRETRMGYEAGVVFDAANLYTYLAQTTKYGSNGDSSFYLLLQPMIDWYENNWARFGMAASPYSTGVWPSDNYDASSSGRTRFIHGRTVEPINYVSWDFTKWYDAQKLVNEVKLRIELAIDGISPDASSGKIVDQYALQKLPADKRALAQRELKAWTDFHVIADGVDSKASLKGPNFQSAFVRLSNIGGVLDARLDFAGVRLYNGALIPSSRLDQTATGPALGLALPVGLVPGLSLSATTSLVGGGASVAENYETKNSEALPGEASWLGVKVKAGYAILDTASVNFSLLWPDAIVRPLTIGATLDGKLAQRGALSYSIACETSFFLWQDRYIAKPVDVLAYSGGVDALVSAFGFSPRALVLYKSAGFWGQGGNDSEDRFPGVDLRGDFNSAKLKDAAAIEGGLGFDPEAFIGMKTLSVEGGYRLFVYDLSSATLAALGQGWFGSISLSLLDLAELPVALSLKATNYTNWGLYGGKYSDWGKAPAAGTFTGIAWSAGIDWDPSKDIRLSLEGSGRETGWRMDTRRLLAVGLKASIKF